MPTPAERAAALWQTLSALIPFAEGDYDYVALRQHCEALIAAAIAPPIDKSEAWQALMQTIAGTNATPLIEALYTYRESLLAWQREVIDAQAREAELAIARLREYTRS